MRTQGIFAFQKTASEVFELKTNEKKRKKTKQIDSCEKVPFAYRIGIELANKLRLIT